MPRAYVVLARNDLDRNFLQLLDIRPNTSLRNFPYTPPGQTGYISEFAQNDAVSTTGVPQVVDADARGLTAYIKDNVEDVAGGNLATSDADAATIAGDILTLAAAGSALDIASINAAIVATHGAGSDLDGAASASTGSVEDVLRILSGEVYLLKAGAVVSGAANAFAVDPGGAFSTPPNRVQPGGGSGGRSFRAPIVNPNPVDQTPVDPPRNLGAGVTVSTPETADLDYRDIRVIVDTPDLQRSVALGAASKLVSDEFTFVNGRFTYGAGGTALDISGNALPKDGKGRAVIVYKANGEVI